MKLNPQNKKDNFFELNWMECGLKAKTHPTRQYAFIKCAYVFVLLISLLHDCLLLMYVLCTKSYNIKMATTTTTKHRFALCYCYYNFFSAHLISCVCGFFFCSQHPKSSANENSCFDGKPIFIAISFHIY